MITPTQATMNPHRVRRTLLILGACWLVLSTAWVARRWYAVAIVEDFVDDPAVDAVWSHPAWTKAPWTRLLPTSQLVFLNIGSPPANGAQLAWAVRVCGLVDGLELTPDVAEGVTPGDPDQARAFLRGLGRQPGVKRLRIAWDALTAPEIPAVLEQFPQVVELHLRLPGYAGAHFPVLPALREVTFQDTPVSDEDLQWILRCPALQSCELCETAVTLAGVRQIAQWRQKALGQFILDNRDLTEEQIEEMRAAMAATCPEIGTSIFGQRKMFWRPFSERWR
jgi:hypothetical protein